MERATKNQSTENKHESLKKRSVEVQKNAKGEDYDKDDAGVDYRATDITRRDRTGKGFAGDDRTNLREDYKRKFGDTDGPAKYYVDYSDKCADNSDYCAIDQNKASKNKSRK